MVYIRCESRDIAPLGLITGDPGRVDHMAAELQNARSVCHNREFIVVTGTHRGVPVTIASAGIGAPSTAIALHELAQNGMRVIVRIGTNMGVDAPLQSVVISTGAARFDGTSPRYLPLNYPAVPDWELTQALAAAGTQHALDVRLGPTASYDAFYPDMAPSVIDHGALDLTEARRAGVLSMDMETSLVLVLGRVLKMKAAVMCLVTVQAEPYITLENDDRAALEHRVIRAALDGLVRFGEAE